MCCVNGAGETIHPRAAQRTAEQNGHPGGGRLLDRQNQVPLLRHCKLEQWQPTDDLATVQASSVTHGVFLLFSTAAQRRPSPRERLCMGLNGPRATRRCSEWTSVNRTR